LLAFLRIRIYNLRHGFSQGSFVQILLSRNIMIRKCDVCGQDLSHYDKKCPKCGATQHSSKIVRKAGTVVRRLVKPLGGGMRKEKDSKR